MEFSEISRLKKKLSVYMKKNYIFAFGLNSGNVAIFHKIVGFLEKTNPPPLSVHLECKFFCVIS